MTGWQSKLPPFATLLPFDAAFRHGNFTRAAEELNYSQASISRRIGELETNLGVSLFERGRHDVTPTAEAETLAASIRLALGELASAAETIRRGALQAEAFTVFSDISLATTLIAPIVGDFQRNHPELDIRVLSSFEPITTTREEFDVAVQYGRNETTPFLVEPIADDLVFPVCSPDLAVRLPSNPSARDLLDLPLLHVDYDEPAWSDWWRFLAHLGVDTAGALGGLTFTSYVVCLDVAQRGEGLALGWARTVQPRIDAGALVRVPGLAMPHHEAINAYRPVTATPNPFAREFIAMLERVCADTGYEPSTSS